MWKGRTDRAYINIYNTVWVWAYIYIYESPLDDHPIRYGLSCSFHKEQARGKKCRDASAVIRTTRRYLSTRDLNHEQVRARACIYLHTLLYTTKVFLRRDTTQTRQRDLRICHERSTDKFWYSPLSCILHASERERESVYLYICICIYQQLIMMKIGYVPR